MAEEQGTAPVADGVVTPHATDNIPVEVGHTEPLIVVKEAPPAETTTEPATAEIEAEGSAKPAKLPSWAEKKLAESAFEAREAKREAKELKDRIAALEARPAAPVAADAEAARASAPDPAAQFGGYKSQADFDTAVQAEATRRDAAAKQQQANAKFDADANTAYEKGIAAYPDDFAAAVKNLQTVGVMNKDFLDLVLETDEPHKVLYELGADPDKAAALLAMPPAKRAIEIAKLSVTAPQKATPTPLSNAPRPITPVDGSARISAEPSDNDSDDVFFQKREAQLRAQRA